MAAYYPRTPPGINAGVECGLRNMQHHAHSIGAELHLDDQETGTCVKIILASKV